MVIAQSKLEINQLCRLLLLVRQHQKDQIKSLCASGVPEIINYIDKEDGSNALAVAVIANDEDMVNFLLEHNADADVQDLQGRTALMRAAEYGHVECFEILLKVGSANTKIRDLKGRGVLFYCISPTERHAMCIKLALEYKADVNDAAKDGRTALYVACETATENVSSCLEMLENGAEANVMQFGTMKTALHVAASSGSVEVVRALLRAGAAPNARDKHQCTPTHEAARAGHFGVVVCLAAYGARFDVYDDQNNNPIHLAASCNANVVKFLGQRGCNPKPKNDAGFQPKIIAKDNGQKECMKELRKLERSFGKISRNNEPWAIELYDWAYDRQDILLKEFETLDEENCGLVSKKDVYDLFERLEAPMEQDRLAKFIPLFDKTKDGRFEYKDFMTGKKYVNKLYLMAAFEPKAKKGKKKGGKGGKKKKTKLPMDVCIMPEAEMFRTYDGGPPVMFVPQALPHTDLERFNRDMPPIHPLQDDSSWYMQKPSRTYVNLIDAAKHNDISTIKSALSSGYHVDTRDKYYKTGLMSAAAHGNLDTCTFLIENGANVNARDNFHWTPLHHACHSGMLDVVELLLKNGAQIDATAMNGSTPLYRAIESSKVNVVQYLMACNARVTVENVKGVNPMEHSHQWADADVNVRVQNKFDSMGPPKGDKDKGKAAKGKGGKDKSNAKGGGGAATNSAPIDPIVQPPGPRSISPSDEQLHERRKASILRAASALAGGLEEQENICITLTEPWQKQESTTSLLKERQFRRERFGWQSDFEDFQMPFQQNIWRGVLAEGGPDED